MICCPNCGHVVPLPTPVRNSACRCHSSGDVSETDAQTAVENGDRPIARFANAAEAGYFAHELAHRLDFEPVVRAEQDFDATSGTWRCAYLLCAPESLADAAAALLHEMCGEEENHSRRTLHESDRDSVSSRFDPYTMEDDGGQFERLATRRSLVPWASLLLTVAAGSVVFWSGRHAGRPPVVPRRQDALLKELLATPGRPWQQPLEQPGSLRQLTVSDDRQSILLQEDRDGDGQFEHERRFVLHGE